MLAEHQVALVALGSRILVLVLPILVSLFPSILRSYDTSSALVVSSPLDRLVSWDAVYFAAISAPKAANASYPFEQFHAFFPGLPLLARAGSVPCLMAFGSGTEAILMSGILVTNLAFVAAAVVLFRLSEILLKDRNLAFASAILFCFSPSAPFLSSLYTESLFALLAFTGMLLHANDADWLAALVWGLSGLVRSNGIVFCGFFVYGMVKDVMRFGFARPWVRLICPYRLILISSIQILVWRTYCVVLQCVIVIAGFAGFQYYGFVSFCEDGASLQRPWCDSTIPLLYSFVQKEYWNVGFLEYWTLSQLPNFLLASPMLFTSFSSVRAYYEYSPTRFWTLDSGFVESNAVFPHVVLCLFLTLYCLTSMHVQVIARFFTSMPCVYWYLAHVVSRGEVWRRRLVLGWFLGYGAVSVVLFTLFYPPA
ncbi:GPI mannosyltransferase 2 [Chytriomyces sp. MP71]|nr:GPI mannosyltransferase 2 [Chytriomyces sp. MP71]